MGAGTHILVHIVVVHVHLSHGMRSGHICVESTLEKHHGKH